MLNHSRFPDGRAHGFAAPLRVALPPSVASVRLLNHSHFPDGRAHGFAAPLRVALPPSVATAHRAGASLRATGLALPCAPAGVWGRVPVAQSSRRALARPPLVSLPTCGSLWPLRGPSAHRAHASLRCPKPYAAAFFTSVASARRAQENAAFPKIRGFSTV